MFDRLKVTDSTIMAGPWKSAETDGGSTSTVSSASSVGTGSMDSSGAAESAVVLGKPFGNGRCPEEKSANEKSAENVLVGRRFVDWKPEEGTQAG